MKDFKRYFVPLALVISAVWGVWWFGVSFFLGTPNSHSAFGDTFGGLNALFTGLALAGVVTAVVLQSYELHLQREELKLTREELRKTADANQEAAKALSQQIGMQLRAAELTTVSALLSSVNSQLGKGVAPGGDNLDTLARARKVYHDRLHDVLHEMGRGMEMPSGCSQTKRTS